MAHAFRARGRGQAAWLVALLAAVLGAAAAPLGAQEPQSQPVSQPATQPASQPDSQPTSGPATTSSASKPTATSATASSGATSSTSAPAEKKDRFFAVINGRVFTVSGPVLERATVLSKNGRIVAVGREVRLPPECEVIDAAGLNVYPGLIAARSGGLFGAPPPEHSTSVFSLNLRIARAAGITTALAQNDAVKLTYGSVDDMVLRRNLYYNLNYSRNRPIERAKLRADLERVRDYLAELSRHEIEKQTDEKAKPPDKEWLKGEYEKLLNLLRRETLAVASADQTQDLLDLADLAQQFGFRLVIRGATEGWIVAERLGQAGVGVVINPRIVTSGGAGLPDERFNRPTGGTIENAARLRRAGVPVAVIPESTGIDVVGLGGRNLLQLNLEAAFTVRGGLTNAEALRTITIDAARILGVDDRVGSIDVGKDADLVVADGDLLSYMTQVRYTIANGRVTYDKAKDTFFAHIRPDGKPEVIEFEDQWPRRLEWRE